MQRGRPVEGTGSPCSENSHVALPLDGAPAWHRTCGEKSMRAVRFWKVVFGIAGGTAIVLLPALAFRWWQDRDVWFPMRVGDRWTYRDAGSREKIVFEVLRCEQGGAFVVERRVGEDAVSFIVSVTPDSVFILGTSGETFDPPFEEFRLPHAPGDVWTYAGKLGKRSVTATFRRLQGERRRFEVEERSSLSGYTTFSVKRGVGVVGLQGKRTDIHADGVRNFDWTLESFERRS
jgi:hypothetical protein